MTRRGAHATFFQSLSKYLTIVLLCVGKASTADASLARVVEEIHVHMGG